MPSLIAPLTESLQQHAHRSAVEGATWLLSYRDLERESERLAAHLKRAGVGPGHVVPMLMARSPQFIVAMLAVLRCGAAYAPIDLASPVVRQQAMLAVLDSPLALVDARTDSRVLQGRPGVVVADLLTRPPEASPPPGVPWPDTPAEAPAYAMFTSGSTGAPKCVLVPHGGVARLVKNADYAHFDAEARWSQMASLAFDAATLEIWAPLLNGGCCVVQELPLPSLDDLADYLAQRRISDAWLTAALFNAMVDDRLDALGGLRQLLIGGERISVTHARACLARWPQLRLINGYGPTENTTFSLCHTISPADLGSAEAPALHIPIGRPIRGTVARVVPLLADEADAAATADPADPAARLRPGAGELWVAGAGVAVGYLNDPVLTAQKFVWRDGQRWYRTGDLVAERADGVYEFFGRADRQVKIQGHRIELEEVERVLAACPGVGNAVVLVQGDTADSRHLLGCYTGLGGTADSVAAPPAEAAVREFMLARLSPKAVPNALHRFERLPLNLNGKVDRAALTRQLAGDVLAADGRAGGTSSGRQDGVPDPADACHHTHHAHHAHHAHWHTETERQLAAIWARCLPQARLDRQSHFMRAGGSSLLALRVAADVGRTLRRQLDALDVLRLPLLADQARQIDAAATLDATDGPRENGALSAADQAAGPALSRSQKSLLLASRLDASGAAYWVHVALQLDARLAPQQLRDAFNALLARHPMLRTAAMLDGDAVATRVLPQLPPAAWQTHAALAAVPTDFNWPQPLLAMLNRPWDLAADGPMHLDLWPLPGGEHLCVWTMHHFALDEASIYLALDELDALLRGRNLPPVYGSPFGFAALESAWTDDAALATQAAAVAQALAAEAPVDNTAPAALPPALRAPLPPAPSPGGEVPVALPGGAAQVAATLTQAAARWGCTPFTPLVVAYGLALQAVFGPAARFVLTPFSRRVEPESIEPIGCLLDLRLIEAGARPGEALAQTISRVHAELLEGQQPRFRPFDRLADAVAAIDPSLRPALTQFAITWRPERRAVTHLAGLPVRVLNVPQAGARFGLTLHVEAEAQAGAIGVRIEAVQAALDDGRAAALGQAFAQQLARLCALPGPVLAPLADTDRGIDTDARADRAAADHAPSAPVSALLRGHASAAWQRWLGRPPRDAADDFLQAGGSSLLALRLAATLRREAGVSLDVAAFLARPSFGALCRQLAATPQAAALDVTLLGARNYQRLMLVLPGGDGGPLGMFNLAQEMHSRLPDDWAVAIVDLPAIMQRAPEGDRSPFFAQQLLQVVRDLGQERLGGVVGFSLGGLLGIDLLNLLPPARAAQIPLWMIDTYAPQRMRVDRRALAARVAINLLRHPLATALAIVDRLRHGRSAAQLGDTPVVLRDGGVGDAPPVWRDYMRELSLRHFDARRLQVTLIHSRSGARSSGLLRHIGSNGFAPRSFGALRVIPVDEMHFDLPRSGAGRVAGLITGEAG